MMRHVHRIAVLNSHPIQYFAPLYAYLNQADDLDITALYMSDTSVRGEMDTDFGKVVKRDIELLSGYRARFLGPGARRRVPGGFFSLVVPEIWPAVRHGRYDAHIVHGHHFSGNLVTIAAAKLAGTKVMMRCETHFGLRRRGVKTSLRRTVIGTLYKFVDSCLAIGSANAAFYRAMGVPAERIFMVPYTVDNDRFVEILSLIDGLRPAPLPS